MISVIAVDWGTSNFRGYALGPEGNVLDRVIAHDGMASVANGGFADILHRHCGVWMRTSPQAPVLMAGMVGSRNGWAEAAYATCPASPKSVANAFFHINDRVSIVPGVIARGSSGPDVMRGEETLVFGSGIQDGLVCLPGTHSKWAVVKKGAIIDFATFMTGESYGLYRDKSLLTRLANEPDDPSGFEAGLNAAKDAGGLLNRLFQARTRVLDGVMTGAMVGPYISGLLIGAELEGAFQRYGIPKEATLVAEGALAHNYDIALMRYGIAVRIVTPEQAFLDGLSALAQHHV